MKAQGHIRTIKIAEITLFFVFFLNGRVRHSPLTLDRGESLLQLVLVLSTQGGEAFELRRAVLGFERQLLTPAHEAARVVPAVDQAQLRLLHVHRLFRNADLVLELKKHGEHAQQPLGLYL